MVGYIYLNEYENGYMYVGQHTYNQPVIDSKYDGSSSFAKRYGWNPVKKEILEICDTREQLNEAERFWIDRYLNLVGVAPCVRDHNPNMAKSYVDGFMLNEQLGGTRIQYFTNSIEAANTLGLERSGVGKACRGKYNNIRNPHFYGGYEFWFKEEYKGY